MRGPVYASELDRRGMTSVIPDEATRKVLHDAILDELCQGVFTEDTTASFERAIDDLRSDGAECVILGCTEIPLIITSSNSSPPVLDSTRLLARYAVREAVKTGPLASTSGWLVEA